MSACWTQTLDQHAAEVASNATQVLFCAVDVQETGVAVDTEPASPPIATSRA